MHLKRGIAYQRKIKYNNCMDTIIFPELTHYHIIELEEVRNLSVPHIVKKVGNEAVELSGNAPLPFVLELYEALRARVPEIVYRSNGDRERVVIFSTLDENTVSRPHAVKDCVVEWSDEEFEEMEHKREGHNEKRNIYFSLETLTPRQEGEGTKEILRRLYVVSPYRDEVLLTGVCPILFALLAAEWFLMFAKSVRYEEVKI